MAGTDSVCIQGITDWDGVSEGQGSNHPVTTLTEIIIMGCVGACWYDSISDNGTLILTHL
ncbi:hypothetical protein ASU33_13750 [Solirubrum puertoriconensis]|uniref:Uncharacterized protein n=1 Tax=Solirubrum puertoriconensis TaxID=1751427 RepID=A0A9X0HKA0_SOLP1|nr:hypothetical protein ASU33_13750 [Solirubrum puertoriconensis]